MLGPTGCGKSFMVELLFQHILKLPTVIVDITSFTESGYIGDDVRRCRRTSSFRHVHAKKNARVVIDVRDGQLTSEVS